jgi:hypothetical protein
VSAVGVKIITFQCFGKFQNASLGFLSVNEAIVEALYVERAMIVDRLMSCFQLLILGWETATSVLKIKDTNIVGSDNPSVL